MVKNLYEALGVQQDVPPEEIRKAYRKMALQTHPDRLQPGASDTDKAYAEEQFRKVNNAYEVLSDEEKRKVYDRHGEWPPPEVQQDPYADRSHHRRHHRHRSHANARRRGDPFYSSPFGDSFFTQPFGTSPYARAHAHAHYGFTDPFTLFDSMFGEMRRHFNDPVFTDAHPSAGPTFGHQPFNHDLFFDRMMGGNPAFRMLPQMNNMFMQPNVPSQGRTANFQSSSRGVFTQGADGNGQWVSQSRMTRSINGVTESVWKRMDSNGNEHITYSYPDGREKHLINGVEQPTISGGHGGRSLPPPPAYPGPTPANTLYEQSRKQGHNRADMNQHPAGPYSSANVKHEHEYDGERERHREHRGHQRDHYEDQDHQKKRLWKW